MPKLFLALSSELVNIYFLSSRGKMARRIDMFSTFTELTI